MSGKNLHQEIVIAALESYATGSNISEAFRKIAVKYSKKRTNISSVWYQTLGKKFDEERKQALTGRLKLTDIAAVVASKMEDKSSESQAYKGNPEWSDEENQVLVLLVLESAAKGEALKRAYEKFVEQFPERSENAVATRWSNTLSKKYAAQFKAAKKGESYSLQFETGSVTKLPEPKVENAQLNVTEGFEQLGKHIDIIAANYKAMQNRLAEAEDLVNRLTCEVNEHKRINREQASELEQVKAELKRIVPEYNRVSEDYKGLLRVMENARQLALQQEGLSESPKKMTFKSDYNGNLEPLNK